MYNVNPFPPPFGVCSICHQHTCGTSPDGEKWIQIPLELFIGGDIHIGYGCIKSMSDNLGIAQEIVEREVLLTPTVEQIGDYVRKAVMTQQDIESCGITHRVTSYTIPNESPSALATLVEEDHETHVRLFKTNAIRAMDKSMLKEWFTERQIPFVPQWGEERLREEALKHV